MLSEPLVIGVFPFSSSVTTLSVIFSWFISDTPVVSSDSVAFGFILLLLFVLDINWLLDDDDDDDDDECRELVGDEFNSSSTLKEYFQKKN